MIFAILMHLSEVIRFDPAWMGINVFDRPEGNFLKDLGLRS